MEHVAESVWSLCHRSSKELTGPSCIRNERSSQRQKVVECFVKYGMCLQVAVVCKPCGAQRKIKKFACKIVTAKVYLLDITFHFACYRDKQPCFSIEFFHYITTRFAQVFSST